MGSPSLLKVATRFIVATAVSDLERASQDQDAHGMLGALDVVLKILGTQESSDGNLVRRLLIQAPWFYALGKRQQTRVWDLLSGVRDAQRQAFHPDMMARHVDALIPEVQWLLDLAERGAAGFQHGPFTIIILPGVTGSRVGGSLASLDTATDLLRKKFPQVLYGTVFLSRTIAHGKAQYVPADDNLYLAMTARDSVGDVHALCHEFGHRYEHRFWKDRAARDAFRSLVTEPLWEDALIPDVNKVVEALLEQADRSQQGKSVVTPAVITRYLTEIGASRIRALQETLWDYRDGRISAAAFREEFYKVMPTTTRRLIREPLFVTSYAKGKGLGENFAEAFAFLVEGRESEIPVELRQIVSAL